MLKQIQAGVLDVGYHDEGSAAGPAAILLHGFPYDVEAYAEVAPLLLERGYRVIVPYLRGYGPTRFLSDDTPRSGQQAVLAHDLLALMDALNVPDAFLAGYDWGGRAACIVAALWPERCRGLVTGNGYNIQDIAASATPQIPENEHRYWYQWYFHGERGRAGLERNRHDLCRLLWKLWSPYWAFDDADYERTAPSFDNPDFVDVVIHSYRHRYALAAGDPSAEDTERRLAARPRITVPTIAIDGEGDGVMPLDGCESHAPHFDGPYERRLWGRIGHNLPQEAPQAFAQAILDLA